MKTPMQELIDTLKELQETQDPLYFQDAIDIAEAMLVIEEKLIIDFVLRWMGELKYMNDITKHFNETFNTKEK